jgi:hypothetical protein
MQRRRAVSSVIGEGFDMLGWRLRKGEGGGVSRGRGTGGSDELEDD